MTVTALPGGKELEKLRDLAFLQISSVKKQPVIHIDMIVFLLKTLEKSGGDNDFSIRTLEDINKDNELKLVYTDKNYKYQKVEDCFKKHKNMIMRKEVPTSCDLDCRKYRFQSIKEENITFYVLHVIKTTDEPLKQYEGKCLVQKVDENHQTHTKP